ncbi:hypothetical protein [Brevundimonas diminuta]|uniref:hypothetical protein n=1 Tax=Brevundimonas diminuta TaxID=293 RepID=UPI0025A68BB3|nr:hypothetical protein [Brevundimonas diminuta]MDM8352859.1 hypothetical protein [Brevundimonas diminuta]
MAEVKHTPGEWRLDTGPSGRAYGVSAVTPLGLRVPVVVWRGIAKPASDEGQANARLIAAAPDLFEAVQALLNTSGARKSGYDAFEYSKAVALAENALSKATAQQEGR